VRKEAKLHKLVPRVVLGPDDDALVLHRLLEPTLGRIFAGEHSLVRSIVLSSNRYYQVTRALLDASLSVAHRTIAVRIAVLEDSPRKPAASSVAWMSLPQRTCNVRKSPSSTASTPHRGILAIHHSDVRLSCDQ